MAFSADELRVLRRALAQVLHPPNQALALAPPPAAALPAALPAAVGRTPARTAERGPDRTPDRLNARPSGRGAAWAEDVQEVLRLAEAIDETVDEAGRMRAFALADLARYRNALPGSAAGYLERLRDAVADGYVPDSEDLSAMRALTALPCAPAERIHRLELRSRCGELAETAVRHRLAVPSPSPAALPPRQDRGFRGADTRGADSRDADTRAVDVGRADVRVAGLRAGNVAEFARPARPQRLRELSRPFPIRPGGPTAMDSHDSAPRSSEEGIVHQGLVTKGSDNDGSPETEGSAVGRPRPIPTPGDLWPRGVRRERGEEDAELATGTG